MLAAMATDPALPSADLAPAGARPDPIPEAGRADSLRWIVRQVLPTYLRGIVRRRPFWVGLFSRFDRDPAGVRLVAGLRRKYGGDYLYLRAPAPTLLVLDPAGVRQVLENSPDVFADPKDKRKALAHFQPGAVTISRGAEWRERRRFNEQVLHTGERVHPAAATFLAIVREEATALARAPDETLTWGDLAGAFERIALRVILGSHLPGDPVPRELSALMREANRLYALGSSRHFAPYRRELRRRLDLGPDGSLAALCRPSLPDEALDVQSQVTHWLFATKDTLALNVAATLAVIVAHPRAEVGVREELALADTGTPTGIDSLAYLEGCVQEAMRLWPTTPLLVREALRDTRLGQHTVSAGTQVMIHNAFLHRDRSAIPWADSFTPEWWIGRGPDYRFNHLSNGPQSCAGAPLALFLAKAFLAHVLAGQRFSLVRPALDPNRPLPYAFDPFRLRLTRIA